MSKGVVNVDGMTCQSCVARVTKAIMSLPGVSDVDVSLSKQRAAFKLEDGRTDINNVISAIEKVGYEANRRSSFDWFYVWGFLILIVLMMIANRIQSFKGSLDGASYGLLFLTGVLTSFHCVAMCGGITLSQIAGNPGFRMRSISLGRYHLGRLVSYTLVGFVLGALGSVAAPNDKVRGVITLVGGVGMGLFALSGILPQWFGKVRLPDLTAGLATQQKKRFHSSLGIGFINGFVPCGPLQGIQLFALASGSALKGGSSMFVFYLGTLPLLFGFGTAITMLGPKFRIRLIKLGYIFVFLLGFMMVMRGIGFIAL